MQSYIVTHKKHRCIKMKKIYIIHIYTYICAYIYAEVARNIKLNPTELEYFASGWSLPFCESRLMQ